MYNGMKMESIHFILIEDTPNAAVLALKYDMNANCGRASIEKCARILCVKGSSYRDKELLYGDALRIYEKHFIRNMKSVNKQAGK